MARPRKPAPGQPIAPSKTSHLFPARKTAAKGPITREAIAADLEAFHKSGGKIEVLGTTLALRNIGNDAQAPPAVAPPQPSPRKRRR